VLVRSAGRTLDLIDRAVAELQSRAVACGVAASLKRPDEEIVVPFPAPRARLHSPTRIRSTLVASSLQALRDRGLFEPYVGALDTRWRGVVLDSVAGMWLPLDAGLAHYRACDGLGIPTPDQLAIGRDVGNRVQGTFIGTMIRAAKGAGATPWTGFSYTNRLYDRLFDGGGCQVTKIGPKDAVMEVAANPTVGIAYFRNAMRGVWQVALELFCRRAYLAEVHQTDTSCRVKVSWV
jgi:hypothetical protein